MQEMGRLRAAGKCRFKRQMAASYACRKGGKGRKDRKRRRTGAIWVGMAFAGQTTDKTTQKRDR
jgi:nicotinamide mononucleotide (NMN) deamidase PncC